MFMIKSRLCHILAIFLFVKELFTVGDIVGKDMYKELKLSLNHNTERLEDISAILKDNTKKLNKNSDKINRNFKMLEHILKFLKDSKPEKRLIEVAQGKRTYQSSIRNPLYPSKLAVDGRLNTIQHTNKEQLPFWVVDLGKIYDIERIEVYNRPNCCGKRLRDLDVLIGPYHNAMKLCAHYAGPSHTGDHLVFKCGGVLPGRYVKLMMRTTEYLHVAEVKVFARI